MPRPNYSRLRGKVASWQVDTSWSPDGSEILFKTNRNGNDDIAAVPVEGGPVRMIADSPLDESVNDISRDGAKLVYFAIPPSNQIVRVGVEPLLEGPGK